MYDDLTLHKEDPDHTRPRHRPIDLVEAFEEEDLEAYAAAAELAADRPDLDLVDLADLYGAADTAREAVRLGRRKRGWA